MEKGTFLRSLKESILEQDASYQHHRTNTDFKPIGKGEVESFRELQVVVRNAKTTVRGRTVTNSFSLADFQEYVHRNHVADELMACEVQNRVHYVKLGGWESDDVGKASIVQEGLIRWPAEDCRTKDEYLDIHVGYFKGKGTAEGNPLLKYRLHAKKLMYSIEKNDKYAHPSADRASRDVFIQSGHGLRSFTVAVHLRDEGVFIKSIILPLIIIAEDNIQAAVIRPRFARAPRIDRLTQLARIDHFMKETDGGELPHHAKKWTNEHRMPAEYFKMEEENGIILGKEGLPLEMSKMAVPNAGVDHAELEDSSDCSTCTFVSQREFKVKDGPSHASFSGSDCLDSMERLCTEFAANVEVCAQDEDAGKKNEQNVTNLEAAAVAAEMAVNSARSAMLYAGNAMAILNRALDQARQPVRPPANMFVNPYASIHMKNPISLQLNGSSLNSPQGIVPSRLVDIQHYVSQVLGSTGKALTGPWRLTDFDEFLWRIQPVVKQEPGKVFTLQYLWNWFSKPSEYGLKVELHPTHGDISEAYFVPFLSAVQLFRQEEECDHEDGNLVVEYFEKKPPHLRSTFMETIEALTTGEGSESAEHSGGSKAKSLCDLEWKRIHERSWFSVAWYPLYRIPDAPFQACFLTYHTLKGQPVGDEDGRMAFPLFALEHYNAYREQWFFPRNGDSCVQTDALHRCEALARNASLLNGTLGGDHSHPDYHFFVSRR